MSKGKAKTKEKKTTTHEAPSYKYQQAYCAQLVKHMSTGFTFKSFGAEINVCKSTLYNWIDKYPEFREAHERGQCFLEKFMMEMGHRISTGNLVRLDREEPVVIDGKVMMMPDGRPAMRKIYVATKGNAASWIFSMRNICEWTNVDKLKIEKSVEAPREKSDDDIELEITQLIAKGKRPAS